MHTTKTTITTSTTMVVTASSCCNLFAVVGNVLLLNDVMAMMAILPLAFVIKLFIWAGASSVMFGLLVQPEDPKKPRRQRRRMQ